VLYTEELARFQSEATATVDTGQRRFDQELNGTGATCSGAVSYQQAFQDAIAQPMLRFHPGITSVYLLDRYGNVLAPENGTPSVGEPGVYLQNVSFLQLRRKALQAPETTGTGALASAQYLVSSGPAETSGVVLIAERYHTASSCVNRRNTAIGFVEVVTNFPRVRTILALVHLVLALSIGAVFVLVALIGGPIAAQALRPLTRMTRTARRIAAGDLSQRVRLPHGGDEIGQLADTFDEMIARIETAFAAQAASEERMRQFIADASHELRTPLTSIRGYTDVLLRGAKDDPETAERVLLATRREAERMTGLVNDLLTLARLDTGRALDRAPVDLIALAGEAVDQARILAGEREVTLRTDGRGRLSLAADADRLKQVLLILLDNALKHGRQTADGWVRMQVWRTHDAALVSVSDNGSGIAPDDLPHIFDRFYRAERAAQRRKNADEPPTPNPVAQNEPRREDGGRRKEGSGLGLAIAQAIVRAHAGTLEVQSEPGNGTTFTVSLPIVTLPAGHGR
jgi:two-component system, OmpR family, sensor kinase